MHLQCLKKYCLIIWKHSKWSSIAPLKMETVNHPPSMKSNTVTRFKIISGLRNSSQNHRRVPVCWNKQFEPKLYLLHSPQQGRKKCKKLSAHTQKILIWFLKHLKNYSSRDKIPLNKQVLQHCWVRLWNCNGFTTKQCLY